MQSKDIIPAAAIYARVSTEDQAERQTVQAQLDFLRKYCDLHQLPVAGEYIDDGISGKIPLAERPEGRRLLDDAEAGRFGVVLVLRVDRLGRDLRRLLNAHDALDALHVAIRSGTEPIDTSTPIGKFIFHLLGSMAELETSTIKDRMTAGRDRKARDGRYVGGVIPFGYDLDSERRYVPSARLVEPLDTTEAELVRQIFERVASGAASADAEAQRLNALQIPAQRRYPESRAEGMKPTATETKPKKASTGLWYASRVAQLIRNPVYAGRLTLKSRNGVIVYNVPPLVDAALWEAAGARLTQNRALSTKNAKRVYLLRGLIRCAHCGMMYSGAPSTTGPKREPTVYRRYRCSGSLAAGRPDPATRCHGRSLPADELEAIIWSDIRHWSENPGDYLADAQAQLRARLEQSTGAEEQRRTLLNQIAEKETERERVLTMYRRGRISMDEADHELAAVAQEAAMLRELVESLRAQEALTAAAEQHLTSTATLLAGLRDRIAEIERTENLAAKREIIGLLVLQVTAHTEGTGHFRKARLSIRYAYQPPRDAVVDNGMVMDSPTTGRRKSGASRSRTTTSRWRLA